MENVKLKIPCENTVWNEKFELDGLNTRLKITKGNANECEERSIK